MSTANSARNRKSSSPERKQCLMLLPPGHPHAGKVNAAIPTDPEVYGSNKTAQYTIGCSMGERAASLYSCAGGPSLNCLQTIVLNAAESLPEHVARGFIVGFLCAIEQLIPMDPRCIESQVRGILGHQKPACLSRLQSDATLPF
jgi:hypothetical protein